MSSIRIGLFCVSFSWFCSVAAQVAIPTLSARVTDLTATLTVDQTASLERRLAAFEEKKGAQIAVLIVPTTEPETIEQYSMRVVEEWKLGRKKVDDGALLIVAKEDRTLRIEVGYGLEGALNDAVSKRIISEVIVPYFKQGDYSGGIEAGIDSMMNVVSGEALATPEHKTALSTRDAGVAGIYIALFFLSGVLRSKFGRFPGALATGGVAAVLGWVLGGSFLLALAVGVITIVLTLFSGIRGVGGGHYGGKGGRGGFGGGGGGFGGGGASGRW